MTNVDSMRRTPADNGARTDNLVAASEPAAWERLERRLPVSYRSAYTRRAHRLGFEAGLEFARLAIAMTHESTDLDHNEQEQ